MMMIHILIRGLILIILSSIIFNVVNEDSLLHGVFLGIILLFVFFVSNSIRFFKQRDFFVITKLLFNIPKIKPFMIIDGIYVCLYVDSKLSDVLVMELSIDDTTKNASIKIKGDVLKFLIQLNFFKMEDILKIYYFNFNDIAYFIIKRNMLKKLKNVKNISGEEAKIYLEEQLKIEKRKRLIGEVLNEK